MRMSRLTRIDQKFLSQSSIQPVEPQPRLGWVHLQVEDLDLGRLLLIASKFGEAIGESVSDAEVHRSYVTVWSVGSSF